MPQLRSVVETEFSCDEVFDLLRDTSMRGAKLMQSRLHSGDEARAVGGRVIYPFSAVEEDFATCLRYNEVPLPWPFVARYFYIVQDYIRVQALDESAPPSFVTYNHEAVHPHFAKRDGFERLLVRYQGLVGVPTDSSASSEYTTSRLTWVSTVSREARARTRERGWGEKEREWGEEETEDLATDGERPPLSLSWNSSSTSTFVASSRRLACKTSCSQACTIPACGCSSWSSGLVKGATMVLILGLIQLCLDSEKSCEGRTASCVALARRWR